MTEEANAQLDPPSPLINLTALHCIVSFALGLLAMINLDEWIVAVVIALAFAHIQVASVFAALGSGHYWKRLAVTQLSLAFVFLSYLGGASIYATFGSSTHLILRRPFDPVPFILVASATTQFVYGVFRFARGWRLHEKIVKRGPDYSVQDLLALTLFVAVVLSAMQASLPNFGDSHSAFFAFSIASGVTTLFYGVPTVATTFKLKETEQGCFAQLIMIVAIGFLVVMPFAAMGADETLGPLVLVVTGSSMATWLALAAMREKGFVLTNGKENPDGE